MRIRSYFIFVITIVFTFLFPIQAAQAWGSYGHHKHGHHGYKHHKYSHHGYGRHGYGRYGYGYKRHYSPYYRSYSSRHYSKGKDCHSTYKYQVDEYGKQTKINGTMCYDDYGKAYIVPGSRYVDNKDTADYEE